MKHRATLISLFCLPIILCSCEGKANIITTQAINRYYDFGQFKEAFDLGVKKKDSKKIATTFNFREDPSFNDFTFVYYIFGFCSDEKKQTSFDDICENIEPSTAYSFLSNETTDICVRFSAEANFSSYSSLKIAGYSDGIENYYSDIQYLVTMDFSFDESQTRYPPAYSKFVYDKEETNALLKTRYKVLFSYDGVYFGDILFSKRTSLENVNNYSNAIKNFIVSETSK